MIHGLTFFMATLWQALLIVAYFGLFTSTIFLILVVIAAGRYRRLSRQARIEAASIPFSSLPPVTILKPVHGMEAQLECNLDSFFSQLCAARRLFSRLYIL